MGEQWKRKQQRVNENKKKRWAVGLTSKHHQNLLVARARVLLQAALRDAARSTLLHLTVAPNEEGQSRRTAAGCQRSRTAGSAACLQCGCRFTWLLQLEPQAGGTTRAATAPSHTAGLEALLYSCKLYRPAFERAAAAAARPRPPAPMGCALFLYLGSIRLNIGAFLSISGTTTKRMRLPLM